MSKSKSLPGHVLRVCHYEELEMYAKESGIECLYLITTSAKAFFDQLGYGVIERNAAPESVKQTAEFSSLCPSSAVVMKKLI